MTHGFAERGWQKPSHPLILIAEDDSDSCAMLAHALELAGYRVITAANGADALTLACLHLPSLIIVDLMMPVMSGEEFRDAQLAHARICTIPVLVMSARHDAAEIAARMRAAGCVPKPLDLGTCLLSVDECLGRARRGGQSAAPGAWT